MVNPSRQRARTCTLRGTAAGIRELSYFHTFVARRRGYNMDASLSSQKPGLCKCVKHTAIMGTQEADLLTISWDFCAYAAFSRQDLERHWNDIHFARIQPTRTYAKRRKVGPGAWLILGPEPAITGKKDASLSLLLQRRSAIDC